MFPLDTIRLPKDKEGEQETVFLKYWTEEMLKPIFKLINHCVNKAGDEKTVSAEGTKRGRLQTVALRRCVNKWDTNRFDFIHLVIKPDKLTNLLALSFPSHLLLTSHRLSSSVTQTLDVYLLLISETFTLTQQNLICVHTHTHTAVSYGNVHYQLSIMEIHLLALYCFIFLHRTGCFCCVDMTVYLGADAVSQPVYDMVVLALFQH